MRQKEQKGWDDMKQNTLRYDAEFDNALFFGQYVMVVTNEKYTCGVYWKDTTTSAFG
jgi:hypothetical protein